jgi:hypothetical protein
MTPADRPSPATGGLAPRPARGARVPAQRSAVTNGKRLFVDGDSNSAWSRRYRDLIAGHVADMGGQSELSEAQLSLVRRASAIECELEQQEGKLSQGEEINLDEFTRAASHLRRILETLGLERCARDVTPNLAAYVAAQTLAGSVKPASKPAAVTQDSPAACAGLDDASDASERTSGLPSEADA